MKEFARSIMDVLEEYNGVVYWITILTCVLIMGWCVFLGYRNRGKVAAKAAEQWDEPLARWEYLSLVYSPRVLAGSIISILLMGVVALPYLIIQRFV